MMYDSSKLIALLLAFLIGFGICAGLMVGIPTIIISQYSLKDLEDKNMFDLPDEDFIGEDPEVDIFDLNGLEMINEYKELQKFGDDLTLNLLQDRYALKFGPHLDKFLSEKARSIPLKQLLSREGIVIVLSTIYIGTIEEFECKNPDGTEGDPADENTYWVNPATGKRISALEEIIADFTVEDFITGNINTDNILHGGISLADILGYTYDEEKQCWIDGNGDKLTGLMSVVADCTLDNVDEKLNEASIGDLLNYHQGEDGKWYEYDEHNNEKPVHSFMNAVANRNINTLGGLFEDITIGDIIPEDQRVGLIAIISPDTKIDEISTAINDSIKFTPLQFFINEGLVNFDDIGPDLDDMSHPSGNLYGKNYITVFKHVNEGEEGYDNFLKHKDNYGEVWVKNSDGNYEIPTWRTQILSNSFDYIISLMSCTAPETSLTPIN